MPKLAANLSLLFNEVEFLDRFGAAADAGFRGVEFLFPYAWPKEQIAERLQRHGLTQVLHNLPPGDWEHGERGLACLPDRIGEFQDSVGLALDYARALGCRQLNCLTGIVPSGVARERLEATAIENLRFAAGQCAAAGVRLLIEPINRFDIPGMFLNRTAQALELMAAVGSDHLYLQYDLYHAQRTEGELAATLRAQLPRIAHIQIADNPGRHEPGTGEINYRFLLHELDALGYEGWVGCEYRPKGGTLEGLAWRAAHGV